MPWFVTEKLIIDPDTHISIDHWDSVVYGYERGLTVKVTSIHDAQRLLRQVGMSDDEIDKRLTFALTGQWA